MFQVFPQVLGIEEKEPWNNLARPYATAAAGGLTEDNFNLCLRDFVRTFLTANSISNQKQFLLDLDHTKRPHGKTIQNLWHRINTIGDHMQHYPNNPNWPLSPLTEHDRRMIFIKLVDPQWVRHAKEFAIQIDDAINQPMEGVIAFFDAQKRNQHELMAERAKSGSGSMLPSRCNRNCDRANRRHSPCGSQGHGSSGGHGSQHQCPPRNQGGPPCRGGYQGQRAPQGRGGFQARGR